MTEYKEHRTFVHDISNMLAIAEGSLKRARKLESRDNPKKYELEIVENFDLSEKYMKECIIKLKEYRVFIHGQESKNNKK
jgi:hypothetical protein